jgi:hypothetical protein
VLTPQIPSLIFYLVAAADLFLPLIIFSTWVYLTLTLAGFPFKSSSTRLRLKRVGRVVMAWSFGRIAYSVITLLTFTKVSQPVNRCRTRIELTVWLCLSNVRAGMVQCGPRKRIGTFWRCHGL